jgi:hypothetical protein
MAIVKRISPKIGVYYYDTTKMVRSTEQAYKRSKASAKSAKTQFKTAAGYKCAKAGSILGKQKGKPITPRSSRAGATLASKMCDNPKKKR